MAKVPSHAEQQRARMQVKQVSTHFTNQSERLRNNWLRFYKLYRFFERGKREGGANLVIPKAFEVVEDVASRITAHDPQFLPVPKRDLPGQMEDIIRQYMEFVWDEQDLKQRVRSIAKNMLIYGTAFAKVRWDVNEMISFRSEGEGEDEVEIKEAEIVREMPTFDVVDIFDLMVDPTEENIQRGMAVIQKRDFVHISELDDKLYFNLDQLRVEELDSKDVSESQKETKFQHRGIQTDEIPEDLRFNLKEYWGLFSPTGDPEDEREYIITTIMDDSVVIRMEENELGFRPFVDFHDSRVPGEFYSVGEIEPIESLILENEAVRNQRMDVVNRHLNGKYIISPDANINPTDLAQWVKGKALALPIHADDISLLESKNPIASSYTEESAILRDIQTITGTINVGQESGRGSFTNTATGERIRAAIQSARYNYKIENLEDSLAELGEMMIKLSAENIEGTEPIRLANDDGTFEFVEIDESIFRIAANAFHMKIEAGSTGASTAAERRNDALAFGNVSAAYAGLGVPIDMTAVFKEIAKQFNKVNLDELLTPGQVALPQGAVSPQAAPNPAQELVPEELLV
jgi:hypothetical protein|tara:strand:+ start:4602 stop:6329 length:1728 start_codon:yes stop_codon:yes gene_type:complete